ncbi:antirestriction protein ArdA [Blautia producta]|uniref:antirestriction protein ArdA n=1 Tax=Blautia producta TaxID=33035 RepID=UPI0003A3D996|nr:antirestriction protein ArdA [Blautia producta]
MPHGAGNEGTPLGNELSEIQAKWFHNISDFFDHKDEIRYYDVPDSASLAEYLVMEEHRFGELPPELSNHIDFISYGHELEQSDEYLFTTSGVFRYQ